MQSTFLVFRFDPAVDEKPHYQKYVVEAEPTDKILDCLNKIRWDQDPTLAFSSIVFPWHLRVRRNGHQWSRCACLPEIGP